MTSEHPWIAVVDGKRPDLPDGTRIFMRWQDGDVWELNGRGYFVEDCSEFWKSDHGDSYVTHYRLTATERKINAAPEHGGQKFLATASPEAPAGEHAPAVAPLRTGLRSYRNRWFEPVKRDPLVLMADVYRRMK